MTQLSLEPAFGDWRFGARSAHEGLDNDPMAIPVDIVFDCHRPARLARFWAAALDGYRIAPYDESELDRLRSMGVTDVENAPTGLVEPIGRTGPRLWFQSVPEAKQVKNRVHFDLRADDFDAEIERLRSLGATAIAVQPNSEPMVLADPEGNEFCLLRP